MERTSSTTSRAGACSANVPFSRVDVPVAVPFTCTCAFGSGAPLPSSTTVPLMGRVCAPTAAAVPNASASAPASHSFSIVVFSSAGGGELVRPPRRRRAFRLLQQTELCHLAEPLVAGDRTGPAMRFLVAIHEESFIMRILRRLHPRFEHPRRAVEMVAVHVTDVDLDLMCALGADRDP